MTTGKPKRLRALRWQLILLRHRVSLRLDYTRTTHPCGCVHHRHRKHGNSIIQGAHRNTTFEHIHTHL